MHGGWPLRSGTTPVMEAEQSTKQKQLGAAELFAVAERVVCWEDDCGRSELQHYLALYAQAGEEAARELSALGIQPLAQAPLAAAAQTGSALRDGLLRQRAHTSALISQLQRARSTRARRPRYVYAIAAIVVLAASALGVHQARDPVVRMFDLGNVSSKKPWRCSSGATASMPLGGTLDTPLGSYFFFTATEDEPWLEVDLQRETRIRSARIRNRDDCCEERAVPLVLEVSTDHEHWQKLDEQLLPFDTWDVRFPATRARWVRLRARAHTALHLHSVVVRTL